MRLIFIILLFTSCLQPKAWASDSILINQLIRDIETMQYLQDGSYNFHKGMFYGYKKYAGFTNRRTPDNNIFFTGLTAFSLKNMLPYLSYTNKQIAQNIIINAAAAYPYYQNKKGLPTYFFWEGGNYTMPNTFLVKYTNGIVGISEDIDDTVIILMSMETSDKSVSQVKRIMDSAANGRRRLIRNTLKKYKYYPAHTTYLGSKMRVDFDFAVHCNVLYFLLKNNVIFNRHDSATVTIVQEMIHNKEYLKRPNFIAPYYSKPSVILYHLARLMGKYTISEFEPYREQIIHDLTIELSMAKNIMDEIILRTSLLRLGVQVSPLNIQSVEEFEKSNQTEFIYYHARAASQFDNPFKKLFLNFNMLNYRFYSPAYNKVLLLEYLIEKNKQNLN